MGRVVSPTPIPLSSGRVVPALVASYDMHGRAVGLFYTQPTGQQVEEGDGKNSDESVSNTERPWQQRTTEGRKMKEEMCRKEEGKVKFLW